VPGGGVVLDLPLGRMRPEADQMPSACKNWFTVGRYADVSNAERGVTWVTLDAPLLQIGGLTANLLNSQTNPDVWRAHVEPTQRLYCWAMNNHWGTNYRAYQDGPTVFRFILRPHRQLELADASRFATGFSQPLLPTPARGPQAPTRSLFTLDPSEVLVTALKPSDDGRALIIRLFNAGTQPVRATLRWGAFTPKTVTLSDTSERPGRAVGARIDLPAQALVGLRADLE
jgi:alpha-mannosidase